MRAMSVLPGNGLAMQLAEAQRPRLLSPVVAPVMTQPAYGAAP